MESLGFLEAEKLLEKLKALPPIISSVILLCLIDIMQSKEICHSLLKLGYTFWCVQVLVMLKCSVLCLIMEAVLFLSPKNL